MWMFFNCDEWKSYSSMNPSFNNEVYRNRAGRRALWRKIKDEITEGSIKIETENISKVREAILGGKPEEASEYITYGYIMAMTEAK